LFTSKGECELREYFKRNFPDDGWTWGGCRYNGRMLSRDLFSKKLKVCIEYDGIWHFKDIHGQLKDKQEKDEILNNWCKGMGYRMIRIKEELYKSNKKFWLTKLQDEVYNGTDQLVKFY
jgi:very-short-patch-repair endonuclease